MRSLTPAWIYSSLCARGVAPHLRVLIALADLVQSLSDRRPSACSGGRLHQITLTRYAIR